METKTIDLNKFKSQNSTVFSGRDRGMSVRKKIDLDSLDKNKDKINIIVPKDTISINSSFFLGLFGKSVRELTEQGFREKYIFDASNIILKNIDEGIERALKEQSVI
jgi:hypothetical protein